MRRTWRCARGPLAILVVAATIIGGCGSGENGDSAGTTTVPRPMEVGSGAFAVTTTPEGWSMYGAYAGERLIEQEADFRGVLYKSVADPEESTLQWTIESRQLSPGEWPADDAGWPDGVTTIDVNGHEGYVFRRPRDNGRIGTIVGWLERPDRVVIVSVPSGDRARCPGVGC